MAAVSKLVSKLHAIHKSLYQRPSVNTGLHVRTQLYILVKGCHILQLTRVILQSTVLDKKSPIHMTRFQRQKRVPTTESSPSSSPLRLKHRHDISQQDSTASQQESAGSRQDSAVSQQDSGGSRQDSTSSQQGSTDSLQQEAVGSRQSSANSRYNNTGLRHDSIGSHHDIRCNSASSRRRQDSTASTSSQLSGSPGSPCRKKLFSLSQVRTTDEMENGFIYVFSDKDIIDQCVW